MTRILDYLRRNAVAALALVCSLLALAGASYAAFSLPANSVGAPQIKNHSIGSIKLDQRSIAASIRAWVIIQWGAGGRLVAKASSSRVTVASGGATTTVTWPHRHFARNCFPSVTPQQNLNSRFALADYLTARLDPANPGGAFLSMLGVAADGTRGPQAAYVTVICP